MRNLMFYLGVFALAPNAFAQTGPGGVGNSTTNPFWVDVETTGGANGLFVSSLDDFSGNGGNVQQTNSSLQPQYVSDVFNGKVDALEFNGGQGLVTGNIPAFDGNSYYDTYLCGQILDNNILSVPLGIISSSGATPFSTGVLTQSGENRAVGRNGGQGRHTLLNTSLAFHVFQNRYDVSAGAMEGRVDFAHASLNPSCFGALPVIHDSVWVGGSSTGYHMDGYIAEAFVFNTPLNTAEDKILQNYISSKYGTTISNDFYAYDTDYGLGVIGIGQDDASNNHLNSIGNGIVRIEKGSLNDGEYLFIGDNGETLGVLDSDVPPSLANSVRYKRIWRADEPSDIGGITLTFELDALTDFSLNPANYRLLIDHTDDVFSAVDVIMTGVYDAINKTVTFTNVDFDAGDYFTLAGELSINIVSVQTGPWSDINTWNCSCIPQSLNNIRIATGHTVTLDQNADIEILEIESGASLVWSGSELIEIFGDVTIDGTIDMGTDGVMELDGLDEQHVDLNSVEVAFNDLTLENSDSVILDNGTVLIDGLLSPNSGVFDFSAGSLIINSTSGLTTGRVGPVGINCSFNGNATVRRFLPPGVAGNRNLASPVIGATLSDWDQDLAISGAGFPDGCAYGDTTASGCYFSVKKYFISQYQDVTSITYPLTNGTGFEVFVGDDLSVWSGATIEVTGTLNDNDVSTVIPNGWHIAGNPFASPVLYSQAITTNFVSDYFYVYDAQSGSYQWYDQVSNTSSIPQLAGGLIASGQGIWVTGFGSLVFPQSSKTSSAATFMRSNQVVDEINLTLKENNSTHYSVLGIGFNDAASDSYDTLDIQTMSVGREQASSLYMELNDVKVTKNYIYNDGFNKSFDLTFKCLKDAYYSISTSNLVSFGAYENVYLIDHELNEMVNLSVEDHYTFYAEKGVSDRFTIVLSNEHLNSNTFLAVENNAITNNGIEIGITQMGNLLNLNTSADLSKPVELRLTNTLGQEIVNLGSIDLSNNQKVLTLPDNLSGVYVVVVNSEIGITTKKIIL